MNNSNDVQFQGQFRAGQQYRKQISPNKLTQLISLECN